MNHPLAWDGGPGDSHGASYLGGIKPSVQHQVSPVQALPRPYPQFSILRPGAFLRPVAFIIPFVMFTKAAIFFLALAAFANAAPYPGTSHPCSIIHFSRSRRSQSLLSVPRQCQRQCPRVGRSHPPLPYVIRGISRVRVHPTHFRSFLPLTSVTAANPEVRHTGPNIHSRGSAFSKPKLRPISPKPSWSSDESGKRGR